MQKKVLVTGISGFAGSHLAEYLVLNEDYDVSGTYLSDASLQNISSIKDKLNLIKIDLINTSGVNELIKSVKPDYLFHLAALTSPGDSFKNPIKTFTNNIAAQINILESVKKLELTARILIISSGDVYGMVAKEDLPVDEETRFMPTNPYAVSKITQDFLGLQYALSYKQNIIRVRPFNHIGPRQTEHFAVAAFSKKIAEIEKGKIEPVLYVGNLEAKRDFTDVRDTVRAYSLIVEEGKIGDVYNIGTGISYKIQDILEKLLSFAKVKVEVKVDPNLFRPSDEQELICDSTKLRKLTMWEPTIPIDKTLKDTLDYWRNII
ncbi:MAG: GDP-mannose 4,6-dehydratase [Candidatus Levybacteria bacterium]|nr:GDP-mannose 4,6-dehydratase [Candidatus Levybacteria bacterium]